MMKGLLSAIVICSILIVISFGGFYMISKISTASLNKKSDNEYKYQVYPPGWLDKRGNWIPMS